MDELAAERRTVDGLLNLYKPVGITSAKALYRVRALTGVRKSGHAGTLDPAADGVLLLTLGKATKRTELLMALPKTYRATARLDVTSLSLDADSPLEPVRVDVIPGAPQVQAATERFCGVIQQQPPVISALKVQGQPAYKRVRRNQEVILKPRPVTLYRTTVLRYAWPVVEFEVVCGRGTYVRAIARDLGVSLGTGGCLTALTRTAVGPFTAAQAARLDDLETGPLERYCMSLPALDDLLQRSGPPAA